MKKYREKFKTWFLDKENNHENGYAKKEFFPKTGVILGQNCPSLSYVALNDLFSEICFVKSSANMLRK